MISSVSPTQFANNTLPSLHPNEQNDVHTRISRMEIELYLKDNSVLRSQCKLVILKLKRAEILCRLELEESRHHTVLTLFKVNKLSTLLFIIEVIHMLFFCALVALTLACANAAIGAICQMSCKYLYEQR